MAFAQRETGPGKPEGQGPPDYTGPEQRCEMCQEYGAEGQCRKYKAQVEEGGHCASWKAPGDEGEPGEQPAQDEEYVPEPE